MPKPPHAPEVASRVRRCPAFALVAAAIGIGAIAEAAPMRGATPEVGEWTVAESTDGRGCFLTRVYDRTGGTTLLLGLERDGSNHLTVLNANWSIKPKDRLDLTYRLSNSSFPDHFSVGIAADGKQGFVTNFGTSFPAHFAASRTLDIYRGEVPVERLSLDGSRAAVVDLRRCVEELREPRPSAKQKPLDNSVPEDPFAPAGRKSKK